MHTTPFIASIALLTAAISTPLWAQDSERIVRRAHAHAHTAATRTTGSFDRGMQIVPHDASANTPGYGWRYFSDPARRRAVVISPQGDYYFSQGKGLHWVAAEQS